MYSLMKSSAKPTRPSPVIRNSTSRPGRGHRVAGDDVADQVPDQRRDDDHRAAHGRRAALGQVPGRAVRPDLLAVAALGERLDRQRGAEQRDEHRDGGRQQDGFHRSASPQQYSRRRLPGAAARDAFTSTTSPGLSRSASTSSAAAPSATATASPCHDRTRRAPASIGAASSPTATSPASPDPQPARRTRPTSSWLGREVSPSSAMWPSTANARPSRGQVRAARRARPGPTPDSRCRHR